MARNRSEWLYAISKWLFALSIGVCLLACTSLAQGQTTTPASQPSAQPKFGCRYPANPHRRQQGCNDAVFGVDEAATPAI